MYFGLWVQRFRPWLAGFEAKASGKKNVAEKTYSAYGSQEGDREGEKEEEEEERRREGRGGEAAGHRYSTRPHPQSPISSDHAYSYHLVIQLSMD